MRKMILMALILPVTMAVGAQSKKKNTTAQIPKTAYNFIDVKVNPATSVKDQASSGTCWSYAGTSFVESELLKAGKGEHDLSDMWIVRHSYFNKAVKYARMHGHINLAAGGVCTDVFDVINEHGIVPEEAYRGLNYGTNRNLHFEMDQVLKNYMDAIISNPNKVSLSNAWKDGINGILDAYLGSIPEEFTYNSKLYTPKSFAQELGFKRSDYQSFGSYTHHEFGTEFILEIPDNYSWAPLKNVPVNEMINIIDRALEKGYTVAWSSDVSEKGFQYHKGFAVLPQMNVESLETSEQARWSGLSQREIESQMLKFEKPVPQVNVTQELRQQWFDNYTTTDDHAMHIVGTAKDQNGTKFYKVKNSWGSGNIYNGYFYASEEFVKAKTLVVIVNVKTL